jgi:hypothetical protein
MTLIRCLRRGEVALAVGPGHGRGQEHGQPEDGRYQ